MSTPHHVTRGNGGKRLLRMQGVSRTPWSAEVRDTNMDKTLRIELERRSAALLNEATFTP